MEVFVKIISLSLSWNYSLYLEVVLFVFLFIVSADLSWQEGSFDCSVLTCFLTCGSSTTLFYSHPLAAPQCEHVSKQSSHPWILNTTSVHFMGDSENGGEPFTVTMLVWTEWTECVTGEAQRCFYVVSHQVSWESPKRPILKPAHSVCTLSLTFPQETSMDLNS